MVSYNNFPKYFTKWLINELDLRKIKYQTFAIDAKITGGGRSFRALREGKRKISFDDLLKIAIYFNEYPSIILAKAELFYKIHKNSE